MAKVRVIKGDNRTGFVDESQLATARAQGWQPATEEDVTAAKLRPDINAPQQTVVGGKTAAVAQFGQMLDEVRAKVVPLMDDVQKAVLAFTAVAQRATDPAGIFILSGSPASVSDANAPRAPGRVFWNSSELSVSEERFTPAGVSRRL